MQILHKSQKYLFLQFFLRPFISTANFTMNKGKPLFEILTCNFIIQELMVAFGPAVSSSFFSQYSLGFLWYTNWRFMRMQWPDMVSASKTSNLTPCLHENYLFSSWKRTLFYGWESVHLLTVKYKSFTKFCYNFIGVGSRKKI